MSRLRGSLWIMVAVSCIVHVAVAMLSTRGPRTATTPYEEPVQELEIDLSAPLEPEPPVAVPEPDAPPEPAAQAVVAPPNVARAPSTEVSSPSTPPSTPVETSQALTADESGSHGSWSVSPLRREGFSLALPSGHGAANAPAASASRVAHDEPPPAPVSTTGGLREALTSSDQQRGYGHGGPAVSAAHDAAYLAPAQGRLVVALAYDAVGAAQSIRVLERSGEPEWDAYVRELLASAKRRRARPVGGSARGVEITLAVDARMALPSGSTGGVKLEGTGGSFDVADLGAKAKKRISARILRESVQP